MGFQVVHYPCGQLSDKTYSPQKLAHHSYLGTHIHNTNNKTNPTQDNYSKKRHFFLLPKIKRWKEKETNANCHWQSLVL